MSWYEQALANWRQRVIGNWRTPTPPHPYRAFTSMSPLLPQDPFRNNPPPQFEIPFRGAAFVPLPESTPPGQPEQPVQPVQPVFEMPNDPFGGAGLISLPPSSPPGPGGLGGPGG
ncbi:hypothetical protein CHU98_g10855, partial [Xylaria longipes]